MIFPPDSLFAIRHDIVARVDCGEISEVEGYREALRADPDDPVSLLFLGAEAAEAGDLPAAQRYAQDAIRNHPSSYLGYVLLAEILRATLPKSALAQGYFTLAVRKAAFEEDLDEGAIAQLASFAGLGKSLNNVPAGKAMKRLAKAAERETGRESPAELEELRPHRLIHHLRERRDGLMEPAMVDEILTHRSACEPLLLGILKEFGSQSLTEDDYPMVERALALLGEMGSVTTLPAIAEFLTLEYEEMAGPADWAFRRISSQHPAETLACIRTLLPNADTSGCVVLGQQIAMMPKVPGRSEALAVLAGQIERLPREEQRAVIFSAIAGYYLVEGPASVPAREIERQYAHAFSEEAHADLHAIREEAAVLHADEVPEGDLSIYDICCTEPEEHHDPE